MKKIAFFFVAFSLLTLSFSFIDKETFSGVGLSPGSKSPQIKIEEKSFNAKDLDVKAGEYVLLNFWASYDAVSRISNVRFNTIADQQSDKLHYVSVSYDKNIRVFEETVKLDKVNADYQYFDAAGADSDLYKRFRLENGFANYLIDKDGIIVAKNISPEKLTELLGQ